MSRSLMETRAEAWATRPARTPPTAAKNTTAGGQGDEGADPD